jgi:hypothetical protein
MDCSRDGGGDESLGLGGASTRLADDALSLLPREPSLNVLRPGDAVKAGCVA